METRGTRLRFKFWILDLDLNLFRHQLLLLLRWETFFCRDVLKVQRVMLIKWENFGAFLS
jgi:hypothetical protein